MSRPGEIEDCQTMQPSGEVDHHVCQRIVDARGRFFCERFGRFDQLLTAVVTGGRIRDLGEDRRGPARQTSAMLRSLNNVPTISSSSVCRRAPPW